ncbi:MAG: DNA-processing protein DprA [Treponema sp.]|nr:DNA-processing protein DprA [Treponema sp.]MCL2237015.1 DNA-processing protein DprA [Treponema sp.]
MTNRGLLDLIISLLPDLKNTDRIMLLMAFDTEEQLFVQSKGDIEEILKRQLKEYWDISEYRDRADRIDNICKMRSIKWVSWADAEYPPLLREIYDPPCVLYYRGILPNPEKSLLGMVGTRKPSPAAAEQAYKIAGNIGRKGVSVISGLALGIDAMSHRGNLISGAPGYAVLGNGIDEIYPHSNKPLAKRILDSGGAVISEYAPGIPPCKWTFPARNRIISGLSRSVLIVEAPKKSGALITAGFALEQGKDLWVASSGVHEDSFNREGTIKLAYDGADIITSACDVIDRWNGAADTQPYNGIYEEEMIGRSKLVSSMADFLNIEL